MDEPPAKRQRATCGICAVCQGEFGKRATIAHLEKHLTASSHAPGDTVPRLHLLVEGAYGPEYWLHLDVRADTPLKKLDTFLRGIWLECCGHLSQFTGGRGLYGIGMSKIGMTRKIGDALTPGMTFSHEYDFGDTTELKLRVLGEHDGSPAKDPVLLLARNLPPEMPCESCGKPADLMGVDYEGEYRQLCEECADEAMEEQLLPVLNSPRAGVCGYTG
ncbi:MAG: hypothetical protein ACRYFS_06945 [Janthinobacterium lividum]